jgi:hypothetical protein
MWMMVSGALLPNRGAMFPALKSTGLSDAAIRRAWVAFRNGAWQIDVLLRLWREYVMGLKGWQEHRYEGYLAVTVDVTACWRPALNRCPSKHDRGSSRVDLQACKLGTGRRFTTS